MRPDFAEQFDIVQVKEPVRVVYHERLAFGKVDEFAHLLLEAVAVVLDLLRSHHAPHIRSSGRVADVAGSAADQGDRLVARLLETLHQAQRHKMPYVKAVRRRVEPDIEYRFPGIDQFTDLLLICHLCDQASRLKFFIDSHLSFSPFANISFHPRLSVRRHDLL